MKHIRRTNLKTRAICPCVPGDAQRYDAQERHGSCTANRRRLSRQIKRGSPNKASAEIVAVRVYGDLPESAPAERGGISGRGRGGSLLPSAEVEKTEKTRIRPSLLDTIDFVGM